LENGKKGGIEGMEKVVEGERERVKQIENEREWRNGKREKW
jgi:hypothetical protein